MLNIETKSTQDEKFESSQPNGAHYRLAAHINALNQARNEFMPGLVFGDPVWGVLLDLFVAEYLEKSTKVCDLVNRLKLPVSVCERCVQYLVDQSAVIKNPNDFTKPTLPLLVSEDTKVAICAWLDSCTVNASQV